MNIEKITRVFFKEYGGKKKKKVRKVRSTLTLIKGDGVCHCDVTDTGIRLKSTLL